MSNPFSESTPERAPSYAGRLVHFLIASLASLLGHRFDPVGWSLLLASCAAIVASLGSGPGVAAASVCLGIGYALYRVDKGEYTLFRIFAFALLVRAVALIVPVVLTGNPSAPIFPDEAQNAKVSLEAAHLLFGVEARLPHEVVIATAEGHLRRWRDDGHAYLVSVFAAAGGSQALQGLRAASVSFGALAVCALAVWARLIVGTRRAKIAALAYSLFPTSVMWSTTALKESLVAAALLGQMACIYALAKSLRLRMRIAWAGLASLFTTVLLVTREHVAFLTIALSVVATAAIAAVPQRRRPSSSAETHRTGAGGPSYLLSEDATKGSAVWATPDARTGEQPQKSIRSGPVRKRAPGLQTPPRKFEHRDQDPSRSRAGARVRRFATAAAAAALVASSGSLAFWMSGYGFLGRDAWRSLDPSFLASRTEMESRGTTILGATSTDESSSAPQSLESSSRDGTDEGAFSRLISRTPRALLAVLLKPAPWETPKGSLARYSSQARMLLPIVMLAWYLSLAAGIIGLARGLRRAFSAYLLPASFLASLFIMYGITQANLGTAFRLRDVAVPVLIVGAVSLLPPPRRTDPTGYAMVLPTSGPGGTEDHVFELASRLAARGRDVLVVVLRSTPHESSSTDVHSRHHCWTSESVAAKVWVAGRRHKLDLSLPFRLAKRLSGRDVCFTYLFTANLWGGLAARLAGSPLVSNIRSTHPLDVARRLLEPLFAGERVVCNSKAAASWALWRGIPPRRIAVLRNGVDPDALRPAPGFDRLELRATLGADEHTVVFLLPARYDPLKDQLTAVRAFKRSALAGRPDKALLVMAGSSQLAVEKSYEEAVRREASETRNIALLGHYSPLAELLEASDVVVLSSVHEGLPNVLLQAGALGKPAIATKAGGIPEVVVDGETGILVEPNDIDALAHAFEKLADSEELRTRLGRAAASRVRRHFALDAEIDRLEEIAGSAAADAAEEWAWGS